MVPNQILLLFFMICMIGFIFSIIMLHKRRLRWTLGRKSDDNTHKTIYIEKTLIAIADITLILAIVFLLLMVSLPKTPFEIYIKMPFDELTYQVTVTGPILIVDVLSATIIILLISTVYLIMPYKKLSDWFNFLIGFILGLGLSAFLLPMYLNPIIFVTGFIFAILLFFFVSSANRSLISVIGMLLGFSYLPGFVYAANTIYLLITRMIIMLVLGTLLGIIITSGLSAEIDFGLLAIYIFSGFLTLYAFTAYGGVVYCITFLLGVLLTLIFTYKLKIELKLLLLITPLILLYFVDGLVQQYPAGVVFVICIAVGQFFIASLYKNLIKSTFKQWLLSNVNPESDKVNYRQYMGILDFNEMKIHRKSLFFVYLKQLILKY